MTDVGQLVCSNGKKLQFVAGELGSRKGLTPGKSAKEGEFRVRGKCRCCGTLGLQMQADWSRLVFYPHHEEGDLAMKRHAYRQAILTRLNGMEGIFQRLQSGRNLGTKGADRTRIRDKGAHEALISIALMSMTAATLTDQRVQRSQSFTLPSPGPAPTPVPNSNGSSPTQRPSSHRSNSRRSPHRDAGRRQVAASNGGSLTPSRSSWDEAIALLPEGVVDF
jgi:hypothetical protein